MLGHKGKECSLVKLSRWYIKCNLYHSYLTTSNCLVSLIGRSRGDRRDRYSAGKRGGFSSFRERENFERTYGALGKRDFGAKAQNGAYSTQSFSNGTPFGNGFAAAGMQAGFRAGNPAGAYQNGYDQQYGSNIANMHNGMNQQQYAYPATGAAPMIGYPMPASYSQ